MKKLFFTFACLILIIISKAFSRSAFVIRAASALLILFLFQFDQPASAQKNNVVTNRILIILDASGSMKQQWQGTSKFDLAKKILSHTIDSISNANTKVEFALRVMGHQFPRAANNCKDSKLEVPFSKNNFSAISEKLNRIIPQGQTPIAYSLMQSLNDFPGDSSSVNVILLITDGNETCGGNLCSLTDEFEKKRIALKPFIVGLGLSDSLKKSFDCLGNFYDVQNEQTFNNAMNVIIKRVLNPTTVQVNLLDAYGNPTTTNVPFTLYDHNSGRPLYNFFHALNEKGNPDTLSLDPKITYDLVVHTFPEVRKENITIVPGTQNIIAADVPLGSLQLQVEGAAQAFSSVRCIVREAGKDQILNVQDFNTSQRYITGNYDLEILTLPRVFMKNVSVTQGKITPVKVQKPGTLSVIPPEAGVASVFLKNETPGGELAKVFDFYKITSAESIQLQPGNYLVIFRPDKGKQAGKTKQYPVTISSGKTSNVKL